MERALSEKKLWKVSEVSPVIHEWTWIVNRGVKSETKGSVTMTRCDGFIVRKCSKKSKTFKTLLVVPEHEMTWNVDGQNPSRNLRKN